MLSLNGDPLTKAYPNDAGYDIQSLSTVIINPGDVVTVDTGVYLNMQPGVYAEVCSRSGLATKGIFVINAPGIIDNGYHGEIKVILGNVSRVPYTVHTGDRIAQLIYRRMIDYDPTQLSNRGETGFGSSGM